MILPAKWNKGRTSHVTRAAHSYPATTMTSVFTLSNLQALIDRVTALELRVGEQDREIARLRREAEDVGQYAQRIRHKQKDDHVSIKVFQLWLQELSQDVTAGRCVCRDVKVEGSNSNPIIVVDDPPVVSLLCRM